MFYLISILPCKILCRTLKLLLLQVIITKKFSSRTSKFLHEEDNNIFINNYWNIMKLIILNLILLFGKYVCFVQSRISFKSKILLCRAIYQVSSLLSSMFPPLKQVRQWAKELTIEVFCEPRTAKQCTC